MSRVYRVQDAEGRGPWRPGLSRHWCDAEFGEGVEALPTCFDEFGHDFLARRMLPGEHFGCAVRRLRDIKRWVSETERARLRGMGFVVVSIRPDRVLVESKNQLVFASRTPLSRAGVPVPWEEVNA